MAKATKGSAPASDRDVASDSNQDIDHAKPVMDRLSQDFGWLTQKIDELVADLEKAPKIIDSDETQSIVEDVIGKARDAWKNADGQRIAEKAPYLAGERAVDQFFHRLRDRLKDAVAPVKAISDAWTLAKVERERVAREAAAAEARKKEEEARQAREKAEREAREAEAAAARKRSADARAAAEKEAADKRAAADAARADERAAMQQTDQAANATAATSADLGRTRHDTGRMNTVKQVPDVRIIDSAKLDLEKLRPYFKPDHLQSALEQFAKFTNYAGTCEGAHIGKKDEVVRR